MDAKNKKTIIVVVSVFIVGVVTLVAIFAFRQHQKAQLENEEQQYIGTSEVDPVSGERVDRTKRDHRTQPESITFLGLHQLLDRGITMSQLTDLEAKFEAISEKMDEEIIEISFHKGSARRIMPTDPNDKQQVDFKVRVNQETDYNATIRYNNISAVELTLINPQTNEKYEA